MLKALLSKIVVKGRQQIESSRKTRRKFEKTENQSMEEWIPGKDESILKSELLPEENYTPYGVNKPN